MGLLSLETSRAAYRADFIVHGAAAALLAALLAYQAPADQGPASLARVVGGLGLWTLLEYLLHRHVLHGLQPFELWHLEHHRRPGARIGTPTVIVAALFAALVFVPCWLLTGLWPACAWTLGLLLGYLAFSCTHHLTHHLPAYPLTQGAWVRHRRHWHSLHHQRGGGATCYGVTSGLWDRVFRSTPHF
jgi:sterol desaturase/sphingolipid hydroxylase (fatty acid hydroxylase superfamily)